MEDWQDLLGSKQWLITSALPKVDQNVKKSKKKSEISISPQCQQKTPEVLVNPPETRDHPSVDVDRPRKSSRNSQRDRHKYKNTRRDKGAEDDRRLSLTPTRLRSGRYSRITSRQNSRNSDWTPSPEIPWIRLVTRKAIYFIALLCKCDNIKMFRLKIIVHALDLLRSLLMDTFT